jgi:mRNA interferase MazF
MRGKVVLVPFPFDDLTAVKVRPAVCLTTLIGPHQHMVLAFITSKAAGANEESDLQLPVTDPDFQATGLKVSSALRLHRLTTLRWSVAIRQLGTLSPRLMRQVEGRLKKLFHFE